ncbi:heterokaryon incompatibility protein-domain-containing protein [Immersiella caudata]|uniref:Heterokaryon incompatibility protein-domain-containing protein n=1 Tax=Immersiella caudata TaxID=314043 RepID=A0AA40BZZ0_9PEZI|nr:heterokaryon incompatibility protein-domain-containing protein [Immersiella caudata]
MGSSAGYAGHRPIWAAETAVTIALRASTIEEWVDGCFKDHLNCRFSPLEESVSPARLIDVGTHRLVDTNTLPSRHGFSYTALSHCWGEGGIPFRTTSSNLDALKAEIPSSSLTPTFRDAILITKSLGIRYLWIDALCIIQDDMADWQREAAKMASVFRCAYVTLAAASPNAKTNGFELADIPPSTQFRVGCSESGRQSGKTDLRIISRPPDFATGVECLSVFGLSPMHDRGWIFQELVLSSRIVHFVAGQLFWQCQSIFESEDRTVQSTDHEVSWHFGTHTYPRNYLTSSSSPVVRPILSSSSSSSNATEDFTWWTWVFEHSDRKLTKAEDDLPSLAGAVDFYRQLTGDEPVVGLWLEGLAFHLSWQTIATDKVPSREPTQPSWSWTSIPHVHRGGNLAIRHLPLVGPPIQWPIEEKDRGLFVDEEGAGMVVLWSLGIPSDAVKVQWAGEPYVSQLLCAELRIQRSRIFDDDNGFTAAVVEADSRPAQHSRWDFSHTRSSADDDGDSDAASGSASGYWTPNETASPSKECLETKTLEDRENEWWEGGVCNAWSVPKLLFDSAEDKQRATADLSKLTCLPIWIRHRYESEELGQYYYQEKQYCYIFEVCSLLLLPVEHTNKYRRVGLSARLFDCHGGQFEEEKGIILERVQKEFESIVIV